MSGTLPLDFGEDARARETWARVLRRVSEVVALVTVKEVAYRLNTSPSTLCDALAERERKNLHARQLVQLLAMPEGEAVFRELADALGWEVKRKAPMTSAEELARLKELIKQRLGDLGEQLLAEVRR